MPAPEPLVKAEPVALLDLVKVAIVIAGYFGLAVPEDTGLKVGAAIVALYAFAQATWFTRKAVTPVARADATAVALAELQKDALFREAKAYDDGLAVGEHEHEQPSATVVEVSSEPSDLDRIVAALKAQGIDNPLVPLAPQPPFIPRPEPKPPAGLYVPDEAVTDTDGTGIPWAPTRVPPPPGLDG